MLMEVMVMVMVMMMVMVIDSNDTNYVVSVCDANRNEL